MGVGATVSKQLSTFISVLVQNDTFLPGLSRRYATPSPQQPFAEAAG
jgi:hypothetical protein